FVKAVDATTADASHSACFTTDFMPHLPFAKPVRMTGFKSSLRPSSRAERRGSIAGVMFSILFSWADFTKHRKPESLLQRNEKVRSGRRSKRAGTAFPRAIVAVRERVNEGSSPSCCDATRRGKDYSTMLS